MITSRAGKKTGEDEGDERAQGWDTCAGNSHVELTGTPGGCSNIIVSEIGGDTGNVERMEPQYSCDAPTRTVVSMKKT